MNPFRPRLRDFSFVGAFRVWQRNVSVYKKTYLSNVLPNFFEPVIYLLGMGFGIGAYMGQGIGGVPYLAYIAPGLLTAAAMNGALFESTYNTFVKLNFGRTYDAIIAAPVSPEDVVLGEILWAVTRSFIYAVAFFTILVGFGFLPGSPILIPSAKAVVVFVPLLVTGFLFSCLGAAYSGAIPRIDLFSYFFTLFITPMFIFSGIFFPLDALPAWARTVALCTPLYHSVRLTRAAIAFTFSAGDAVSLLFLLVAAAVLFYAAVRGLKRKLVR